jgi:hypothetical protein
MDEIMAVLDVYPQNRVALEMAGKILHLCSRSDSPERIHASTANDPLLDGLFSQCQGCFACWPANPILKNVAHVTVLNPIGGRCSNCKKVWCRNCARGEDSLICPECRINLEILTAPSGRRRGLRPAKHPDLKLRQVYVFKAPPEPRNVSSFVMMVLDCLCPEALQSHVEVSFRTGNQGIDQTHAIAYAVVGAVDRGVTILEDHTFVENFANEDGVSGIVVTIYEPRQ